MINLHIDEIEKRWGAFKKVDNAKCNCLHKDIKEEKGVKFYSNLMFDPIPLDVHVKKYKEYFNCEIPQFLRELYSIINGINFFFGSIIIFGHVSNDFFEEGSYLPESYPGGPFYCFTTFTVNYEKRYGKEYPIELYDNFEYRYFGAIGNNHLAFKPGEEKIYVFVDGKDGEFLKTYDSFQECYDHYFYGLMEEYDDNGLKKHPNKMFKKFPLYYNKTFKDF